MKLTLAEVAKLTGYPYHAIMYRFKTLKYFKTAEKRGCMYFIDSDDSDINFLIEKKKRDRKTK
jgi:hypothetical protein